MTPVRALLLSLLLVPVGAPQGFKEAKKALDAALDSGDETKILEALGAVAGTGEARAVELLVKRTAFHESLDVREQTIEALRGMTAPAAVEALAKEASGRKPDQKVVLLRALVGLDGERVRRVVESALRDGDWRVRLAGLRVQAGFPGESVPKIVERLVEDEHPRVAHAAAEIVSDITGTWPPKGARPAEGKVLPEGIPAARLAVIFETSDRMEGRVMVEDAERDVVEAIARMIFPSLEKLPRGTEVNLFAFSGRVRRCFDEPEAMKKATLEEAEAWLGKARAGYGADIDVAIQRAFEDEDLDTLYVIASGTPLGGRITAPEEVNRRLREANFYRDVAVHTIHVPLPGLDGEATRGMLEAMAGENGGTFRTVTLSLGSGGAGDTAGPAEPKGPKGSDGPEAPPEGDDAGGFVVNRVKGRIPEKEWKRIRAAFDEALRKAKGEAAVEIVRGFCAADDERAVEQGLREALFHESLEIAEAAEEGLGSSKSEEAIRVILKTAGAERDPGKRVVYARLLGRIEGGDVDAELVKLVRKGIPWPVRSAALLALRGRSVDTAKPALERIVGEEDLRLSPEAAETLRSMGEAMEAYPVVSREGLFPSRFYGDRVAFAVDTYASMSRDVPSLGGGEASTRLDVAREAVGKALERLEAPARFNVYRYGIRVSGWQEECEPPTGPNLERAREFLGGARTDPGGRDLRGLLLHLLDADVDTVYLLTDGVEAEGRREDLDALRLEVRGKNRTRNVRIHTVLIHPEPDASAKDLLRALAEDSGGTHLQHP